MSSRTLKAPFPWFGGKSTVAAQVWQRFGKVRNYIEPFFGSGAMLLGRPQPFEGPETVNDADGMVANFWRALQADPEAVAHYADWPVNENDLHARHAWLVEQRETLTARLEGDPDYHDARIAGWWCWGQCCWIGGGFCSGKGPWRRIQNEGSEWVLAKADNGDAGQGVSRRRPHLGDAGRGVKRQGENDLRGYMDALADRLRNVRVCCGDWTRVCGPSVTTNHGLTAVFLDPPYSAEAGRSGELYATENLTVAHDVRAWCLDCGDNPKIRIALCGYEGEHEALERAGWTVEAWKTQGGYGKLSDGQGLVNAGRERIWYSPYCIKTHLLLPFGD